MQSLFPCGLNPQYRTSWGPNCSRWISGNSSSLNAPHGSWRNHDLKRSKCDHQARINLSPLRRGTKLDLVCQQMISQWAGWQGERHFSPLNLQYLISIMTSVYQSLKSCPVRKIDAPKFLWKVSNWISDFSSQRCKRQSLCPWLLNSIKCLLGILKMSMYYSLIFNFFPGLK